MALMQCLILATIMPNRPPSIGRHTRKAPRIVTKEQMSRAMEIRNTALWQRHRDHMRDRYPMCVLCSTVECPQPAESVHHIKPLELYPDLAFTDWNTAPVCNACHGTLNQLERTGRQDEAEAMFDEWVQLVKSGNDAILTEKRRPLETDGAKPRTQRRLP